MPKRLAITIAGAVSLGSYEAGVLSEVIDAIRQHNADPRTLPGAEIVIDVLTGASAGGMTAIILAHKLFYNADEFRGPYDNPAYNVWVKRIDLKGLLDTGANESAVDSLFSSDLIETISHEMILARYDATPLPAPIPHPAIASKIYVSVAMTNLNGVDYGYPVEPGGRFVYTRYVDQRSRPIDSSSDNAAFWEPLREAAVACGAFPIAFRPRDIERSRLQETDDYPNDNILGWPTDPVTFTYSDGGILQNQPLGMAKNFVDKLDNHKDQENRFYLFVSPLAKDPGENKPLNSSSGNYARVVARLIKLVVGQAGFQDWITAEGLNKQIALLDKRAAELCEKIAAGKLPIEALQTTADALLELLFPDNVQTAPGACVSETLDQAKERIALQYASEMKSLGVGSPAAIAFRDSILAFESAAGLGARDPMRIYGVTASHADLAGSGVESFLGFFDQTLRDHDYDVGRTHAQKVLSDPALTGAQEIGPIHYTPSAIRPIDASLNGLIFTKLPSAVQQEFKGGLKNRIHQMIEQSISNRFKASLARGAADLALDALYSHLDRIP